MAKIPMPEGPRVAFVWTAKRSPSSLSGMPWAMEHALVRAGLPVVPIIVPIPDAPGGDLLARMAGVRVRGPARRAAVQAVRLMRRRLRAVRESVSPETTRLRTLRRAQVRSIHLTEALAAISPDVVFGSCISAVLSHARLPAPLVYFSDATAKRINTEYPKYAARGRGYHQACDELEARALSMCAHGAFASEWARSSAIEHYAMAPERTSVIPMGANITPRDLGGPVDPAPPTRDELRLCIVAAEPKRKGVDLAVRATELLRAAGWRATLDVVGPPMLCVHRSRAARSLGRLDLSRPDERRRLAGVMAGAHVHLLPSRAEAFGIAACEAAHFGRPAVVSDAGGLKTIVQDGRTGRVVPNGSRAETFAQAILQILEDPEGYTQMSRDARERAAGVLNWDAWGRAVKGRIDASLHRRQRLHAASA